MHAVDDNWEGGVGFVPCTKSEDANDVTKDEDVTATPSPHNATGWRPIAERPRGGMFIWARKKPDGKWAVGLGYVSVSGGLQDAYGGSLERKATHWHPMPEPPSEVIARHDRHHGEDEHAGRDQTRPPRR